jgi:hypothetical protein
MVLGGAGWKFGIEHVESASFPRIRELREGTTQTRRTKPPASISRGNTLTQGWHAQAPGMANQIEAARGPVETFWGRARGVNGQTKLERGIR